MTDLTPQPAPHKTPRTWVGPSPTTTPPEAGNVYLPLPDDDDVWHEWRNEQLIIGALIGFCVGLVSFLLVTLSTRL